MMPPIPLHKSTGRIMLVWAATVMVFTAHGCSPGTRHKILTFFFTGVPPLEKADDKNPKATAPLAIVDKPSPKIVLYSHTPYAQRDCSKCHRVSSNSRFRMMGNKKGPPVFRKGGGMPGPLLKPKCELCFECHNFFTKEKAVAMGLWLHSPRAEGDCGVCHDPHQSKYPNQMRGEPSKLCQTCHPKCPSLEFQGMTGANECLTCHNPHFGRDRMMLRRDYLEQKHPVDAS